MTQPGVPIYTADQVDAILKGYYTQDDVDALIGDLQDQINEITSNTEPPSQPPTDKRYALWGSGDMSAFKGMPITAHRTYFGVNMSWGYNPKLMAATLNADYQAGRASYTSIGAGVGHSSTVKDWPTSLNDNLPQYQAMVDPLKSNNANTVLIPHHEPENDPGNPENFKTWFGLVSDFYRKAVPGIKIGVCLMSWTGRQGGPGFAKWAPDPSKYDVFCIDGYAHTNSDTAGGIFTNALAFARSLKKPLMITETGQEMWNDQSGFLNSLDAFIQNNNDVLGSCYWNGGQAKNAQGGHNYHLQGPGLKTYSQILAKPLYAIPDIKAA